jgi:hypothetical protein
MSFKLEWDKVGEKLYETGVDRGVVYPQVGGAYPKGAAWNGLSAINESPSGAEPTPLYANNRKYLELMSAEEFGCTIEAYMYPDEFAACNGLAEFAPGVQIAQQTRVPFGLSYRTIIGNDTEKNKYGYKIHLVYGATASPSEKSNNTVNEDPDVEPMSWECTTTPVEVEGFEPTAHFIVDSTKIDAEKLAALENILYGSGETEARLPLPDELATLIGEAG